MTPQIEDLIEFEGQKVRTARGSGAGSSGIRTFVSHPTHPWKTLGNVAVLSGSNEPTFGFISSGHNTLATTPVGTPETRSGTDLQGSLSAGPRPRTAPNLIPINVGVGVPDDGT